MPTKFHIISFLGIIVVAGFVRPAAAQTAPALGQRGFQPGAAYTVDQLENINTVSGNVYYHIPLASLPAGPASPGMGLGLVYNSQIWDAVESARFSVSSPTSITLREPIQAPAGGWRYSYVYTLDVKERFNPGSSCTANGSRNNILTKVIFPDGSEHILTPVSSAGGGSLTNDGYFDIDPRSFAKSFCGDGGNIQGDLVYFTTDGSYARVVIKDDGRHDAADWLNKQWLIFLTDGTVVRGSGGGTNSITDPNGNVTTINAVQSVSGRLAITISDSYGRALTEQPNSDGTDTVSQSLNGVNSYQWTVTWGTILVNNSVKCEVNGSGPPCEVLRSFPVVTKLALSASGVAMPPYTFGYSSSWGELNSVVLPGGSSVSYTYQFNGFGRSFIDTVANPVTTKVVNRTEGDAPETWSYNIPLFPAGGGPSSSIVTAPDGGVTTISFKSAVNGSDVWARGLVYKIQQPNGHVVERVWCRNKPWQAYESSPGNPYVAAELTTSNGKTFVTEYRYDKNGNARQTTDYDWAAYSAQYDSNGQVNAYTRGVTLRTTIRAMHVRTAADAGVFFGQLAVDELVRDDANAYWNAAAPAILNLPDSSEVRDVSNALVARTEFGYDAQGNMKSERHWDSTRGSFGLLTRDNAAVTERNFSGNGALLQVTDPNQFTTVFDYSQSRCGANLYPNTVTTAVGNPESRSTGYFYDCGFGVPTQITDLDNNIVHTVGLDSIGRPNRVTEAAGTTLQRVTRTDYDDTNRNITETADLDVGKTTQTKVHYDDQHRERLRQLTDDNGALGINIETRYRNTLNSRLKLVSNPYRSYADPTMGWTLTTMDQLGRVSSADSFGATPPDPWGGGASLGKTTWFYSGNSTTATEPDNGSGIHVTRTSTVDGLGRLGSVTDSMGTTQYTYNALGA